MWVDSNQVHIYFQFFKAIRVSLYLNTHLFYQQITNIDCVTVF